ncbi:hypothetical protein NLU13_3486 [Sarocladium strictum]|uniref:Uncharacterized protein n=1 Tax=Sarocladium strictum TaxID=5046 RepID=A0AA39LAC3_SARSR|nr:hypothetical protein NLU13_3486 [Sarocladium strictum]
MHTRRRSHVSTLPTLFLTTNLAPSCRYPLLYSHSHPKPTAWRRRSLGKVPIGQNHFLHSCATPVLHCFCSWSNTYEWPASWHFQPQSCHSTPSQRDRHGSLGNRQSRQKNVEERSKFLKEKGVANVRWELRGDQDNDIRFRSKEDDESHMDMKLYVWEIDNFISNFDKNKMKNSGNGLLFLDSSSNRSLTLRTSGI